MPAFVLTLLGSPALATGEGAPAVPALGVKAIAMLAYLQLERRTQSREALASLLWGESPEVEARASLRQAVKHLRDTLGDILQADRTTVRLAAPLACDVTEFRALVDDAPARAAAYDIPRFLEGFSVRKAPLFDDWVVGARGALLRQYHDVLGRASREAMAQWRWREAAELADRWLASDPFADEAAQLAVEARYLGGHRSGALNRYVEYRDLLHRETGRDPSRALESLARRVEADRGRESPPIVTDEWYVHAPTFEASLVGREAQWKALTAAWKRAGRGQGQIVLVEGESGAGKSRLSDEFLRWVVADGGTVLRGRSYDRRTGVPFEPLVEMLRDTLEAPGLAGTAPEWLAEVSRLVPEVRDRFPGLASADAQPGEGWRLFEGVAQLLASVAAERPVAIAMDDLHWCDEDSCQLLRFLTRRLERSPILWLGVLTPGEIERDAPAARLCRVLRAKSHAEVVTVSDLTEDEVWSLLREMGDQLSAPNVGRRFAARLHRITAGNPFYLIELLKTMFAQGLLARDETTGEWTVAPDAIGAGREVPVSQTVQDVIAERVDRLPDELRDVLITIAVGGSCRPDVLSHVHGISRLHAAALGDALVDRHLAVEEAGAYRCTHLVIAHMVRDGLTVSRRQETHRSLALALEAALGPEDLAEAAAQVARHADRGGERALAYRHAVVAAEAAAARYAYAEALSWLDLAASSARGQEQSDAVDALTADVLERGGLSEAPRPSGAVPITREIVSEDLDLRVRG